VPGLGLLAAGIAVARRTRRALWRVVAVSVACAAWGALSVELFAQRDRELLAHVRELRAQPDAREPERVNVVVVAADALRRDHLSLYGYERPTSPELDRFAADALVFERAFAQAPSTKPAIASLFTSRFPSQHRAIDNEDALDPSLPTLAELLQRAGYRTGAFVENPIIGAEFGYQRGFEDWAQDARRHRKRARASERMQDIDGAIALWLGRHRREPFFLYLHFIDPHSPYAAPPPYLGRFGAGEVDERTLKVGDAPRGDEREAQASYDEEISYIDARFGALIAQLRELGLLDSTAVVFLADHGEGFGEHGYIHHSRSVYSDLVDIPLVIRFPARVASGRSDRLTQHVDLAPTILDLVGIEAPPGFEGTSLLVPPDAERSLFIEHLRGGWGTRQRAVVRGRHKLVRDLDSGRVELFDIASDPHDRHDLLPRADAQLVRELTAQLDAHAARATGAPAPQVPLTDETRSALEALGYLR
jgi:arylsulfatase A-like enzyme